MKPEDLVPPFPRNAPRITIDDGIWYVPPKVIDTDPFSFSGWNDAELFPQAQPICIEYCSGNGAWIASQAQLHPQYNWIAIEKRFDRVRKIWAKRKNYKLDNLLIIWGEGYTVTHCFIPPHSVQSVYINFPDPWPKRRHHLHRLIQLPFLKALSRILEPQGEVTFVTDDQNYSEEAIHCFSLAGFQSSFPTPYYLLDLPNYGSSYFETLWREKGRPIRYHRFNRNSVQ